MGNFFSSFSVFLPGLWHGRQCAHIGVWSRKNRLLKSDRDFFFVILCKAITWFCCQPPSGTCPFQSSRPCNFSKFNVILPRWTCHRERWWGRHSFPNGSRRVTLTSRSTRGRLRELGAGSNPVERRTYSQRLPRCQQKAIRCWRRRGLTTTAGGGVRSGAFAFHLPFVLEPDGHWFYFPARNTRKSFRLAHRAWQKHAHATSSCDSFTLLSGWMGIMMKKILEHHELNVAETFSSTSSTGRILNIL